MKVLLGGISAKITRHEPYGVPTAIVKRTRRPLEAVTTVRRSVSRERWAHGQPSFSSRLDGQLTGRDGGALAGEPGAGFLDEVEVDLVGAGRLGRDEGLLDADGLAGGNVFFSQGRSRAKFAVGQLLLAAAGEDGEGEGFVGVAGGDCPKGSVSDLDARGELLSEPGRQGGRGPVVSFCPSRADRAAGAAISTR